MRRPPKLVRAGYPVTPAALAETFAPVFEALNDVRSDQIDPAAATFPTSVLGVQEKEFTIDITRGEFFRGNPQTEADVDENATDHRVLARIRQPVSLPTVATVPTNYVIRLLGVTHSSKFGRSFMAPALVFGANMRLWRYNIAADTLTELQSIVLTPESVGDVPVFTAAAHLYPDATNDLVVSYNVNITGLAGNWPAMPGGVVIPHTFDLNVHLHFAGQLVAATAGG